MSDLVKKTVDFEGRVNVSEITNTKTGEVSYLTPTKGLLSICREDKVTDFAIDEENHVLALFRGSERMHTFYMCKQIQGFDNDKILDNMEDLRTFESWNPKVKHWVPCLTYMVDKLESKKVSLGKLL
jgi:hypothetical protein